MVYFENLRFIPFENSDAAVYRLFKTSRFCLSSAVNTVGFKIFFTKLDEWLCYIPKKRHISFENQYF